MKSNEGGPAFPCEFDNPTKEPISFGGMEVAAGTKFVHEGMSLRAYIATHVLAGLIEFKAADVETDVKCAVNYADALLAELAK